MIRGKRIVVESQRLFVYRGSNALHLCGARQKVRKEEVPFTDKERVEMRKNPMPSPSQVFKRIPKWVLADFIGFLAFLATAFALLLVFLTSGCDAWSKYGPFAPGIRCGDEAKVVEIIDVRQYCYSSDSHFDPTCLDTAPDKKRVSESDWFETSINTKILAVWTNTEQQWRRYSDATENNSWAITIAGEDRGLATVKVGDKFKVCGELGGDRHLLLGLPDREIMEAITSTSDKPQTTRNQYAAIETCLKLPNNAGTSAPYPKEKRTARAISSAIFAELNEEFNPAVTNYGDCAEVLGKYVVEYSEFDHTFGPKVEDVRAKLNEIALRYGRALAKIVTIEIPLPHEGIFLNYGTEGDTYNPRHVLVGYIVTILQRHNLKPSDLQDGLIFKQITDAAAEGLRETFNSWRLERNTEEKDELRSRLCEDDRRSLTQDQVDSLKCGEEEQSAEAAGTP